MKSKATRERTSDTGGSSGLRRFLRETWPLLTFCVISAAVIIAITLSTTGGRYAGEAFALMGTGLLGGALIRWFLPEKVVTVVFAILVAVEWAFASQLSYPWPPLAPVLLPANAIGAMVGNLVRQGVLEAWPAAWPAGWVVNGVEYPRADSARSAALTALSTWDSAKSGRLFVQHGKALFEAVGSPTTGFIVHCAQDLTDMGAWRVLGVTGGKDETEIVIPSGPVYAPSGVVVGAEPTRTALLGFFHHRAPAPELKWESGDDALEVKFG